MALFQAKAQAAGTVILYPVRRQVPSHERAVHHALAHKIARLMGAVFRDDLSDVEPGASHYLIPTSTLVGLDKADALGIHDENSLFGALVPHAFVATKAISHPLLNENSTAPLGWSADFASGVASATLRGVTAFSMEDAIAAGVLMLADGPVRIKPVLASGGRGQTVVDDETQLRACLELLQDQVPACGVVLEENLEHVTTYSVGVVRIAGMVASYWGTQRLTPDNRGEMVYGGSDLHVVRGGLERLLACDLSEPVRLAVEQAHTYDAAALRCFPGFVASRRNYDVAAGIDQAGQARSGVLEQSWRIGGASSAEVAAMEIFQREPGVHRVATSSVEVFGQGCAPPAQATVFFQGEDEEVGFITKYVLVHDYGNTQ